MLFEYFSLNQIIPLISSIVVLCLSVVFFKRNKNTLSIIFLFIGAFGLGCFMALLDPYIHTWDELFHALVSKNMIVNPFYPVLYKNTVLEYDYKIWTDNNIWLHKQPLFLWQIALSMKIFGVNEFSLRLPSIILHAILPLLIYRIGKISLNNKIGFYGALFFLCSYYPLELISGKYCNDHNDIAFLFYITSSFWAWFEYTSSKKNSWLILIGLFAGCAVLVKWLMGLLVYVCWAFTFLSEKKHMFKWKLYIPFVKSFMISLVVSLPWQVYILNRFPVESKYEYSFFSKHLFEVIEGHRESFWFHFESTKILYGSGFLMPVFLLISLFFLFRKILNSTYKVFIFSAIAFVYIFYSISATKMPTYTIIVAPFIYLGLSSFFITGIDFIERKITQKYVQHILSLIILVFLCYSFFNFSEIRNNHTMYNINKNDNRFNKITERKTICKIESFLPNKNYIIFNASIAQCGNIAFMFYSDYTAYSFIPTHEQCKDIFNKGYNIAVINYGKLPDYIVENKKIIKIPVSF